MMSFNGRMKMTVENPFSLTAPNQATGLEIQWVPLAMEVKAGWSAVRTREGKWRRICAPHGQLAEAITAGTGEMWEGTPNEVTPRTTNATVVSFPQR